MRHASDWRMLAYLAIVAGVTLVQWQLDEINPLLYAFGLFMSFTVSVISHNHNHSPIFKGRVANLLIGYVISLFYGHPAFVWIPVHNRNHHKFVNGEGDLSITYRLSPANNLFTLLTYPTMSSIVEMRAIGPYLRDLRSSSNRWMYWANLSQYVVFYGVMIGLFVIDWRKALLFMLIPQQFSLFVIHIFNYVQHVNCDKDSPTNHSRNFVSPVFNAILFNNGYHTVHHDKPAAHWSETPALHAAIASSIHPSLNVGSWWGWMFKTYLLGRPAVLPAASATTASATAAGLPNTA